MKGQKFFRGQRVRVADDLGEMMGHLPFGCDAIVAGSFSDQTSGTDEPTYALLLKNNGIMGILPWYEESQLTLVSDNRVRGEEILQKHKRGDDSWLSEK